MIEWADIARLLDATKATEAIRRQTANVARSTGLQAAYTFAFLAAGGLPTDIPRI